MLRRQCRSGKRAGPGTESAKAERREASAPMTTVHAAPRQRGPVCASWRSAAPHTRKRQRVQKPGRDGAAGTDGVVSMQSARHQSHCGDSDDDVIPAEGRRTQSGGPRAGIQ
jgi:hypothetical protein